MKQHHCVLISLIMNFILLFWCFTLQSRVASCDALLVGHFANAADNSDEIEKLKKEVEYNSEWRSIASPRMIRMDTRLLELSKAFGQ